MSNSTISQSTTQELTESGVVILRISLFLSPRQPGLHLQVFTMSTLELCNVFQTQLSWLNESRPPEFADYVFLFLFLARPLE